MLPTSASVSIVMLRLLDACSAAVEFAGTTRSSRSSTLSLLCLLASSWRFWIGRVRPNKERVSLFSQDLRNEENMEKPLWNEKKGISKLPQYISVPKYLYSNHP